MRGMSMSVGERDKKMSDLASEAAEAFLHKYEIGDPETFLQSSIPYLTVRTLHRVRDTLDRQEKALDRQEKALKSLERDSRWIKRRALIV